MAFSSPYLHQGRGVVPSTPLLTAAWQELEELPAAGTAAKAVAKGLGSQLDFTSEGLTPARVREFFEEAIAAANSVDPIVESGNRYSVNADFTRLNGEILLHQLRNSSAFQALSDKDRARADEIFSMMCLSADLRNRNPLHYNPLDSAVTGNLLNFPKHIFGFPFGCYSTNGNEALSLCLYAYRNRCLSPTALVVYVLAPGEDVPPAMISGCCARLFMEFRAIGEGGLDTSGLRPAVVLTRLTSPSLGDVAAWAASVGSGMHIHVLDEELRAIFAANQEPVHFKLPALVGSMSLHDGLFNSGYQLYRDVRLRDAHIDMGVAWQTNYASTNEGGSGNSTPFYIDFCFILLGWSALRDIAMHGTSESSSGPIQPLSLGSYDDGAFPRTPQESTDFDEILCWAKESMTLPREELERHLVGFQRNFVGGKSRDMEALVTAGGTRSINLAFESVLARAKQISATAPFKVVTGNPHLAVERAERRFQFELIRVVKEGALCVEGLKREIADPRVVAVYTQTLCYTDGITDPLPEIVVVIEAENRRRSSLPGSVPVSLINDCCLALSVLIHNDGQNGNDNMRVLELTEGGLTPTIVTLDAHKHLGADKGVSMVVGTPGTLSSLAGRVRVGAAPSRGELARAVADLSLMGVDRYYQKYHDLAAAVADLAQGLEAAGMTVVHAGPRARGSTVIAFEDPSGLVQKKLKKLGHGPSSIFLFRPEEPALCQNAWMLSFTPHAMRPVGGGKSALEIFARDAAQAHKEIAASGGAKRGLFHQDSLPGILLAGGNEDLWLLGLLNEPGLGRELITKIARRIYALILDGGVACTEKRQGALRTVTGRALSSTAALLALRTLTRSRL